MLLVAFIEVLLVLLCLVFGLLVCRGGGGEVCWCASVGAKNKVVTIQIQKL